MSLRGDVLEPFAIHVAVETVLPPVSDEQVGIPVVVIVARADTFGPAGRGQAEFGGEVGEVAMVVVVVHAVGPGVAGKDEDVQVAIVVVIDEGDAAAGGLDNVVLALFTAVR